jgi:hypothetical protein
LEPFNYSLKESLQSGMSLVDSAIDVKI